VVVEVCIFIVEYGSILSNDQMDDGRRRERGIRIDVVIE
jgi:hypothetical protein